MPFILGTDCGGEVESVGSGVSKFKVRIAICIRLKATCSLHGRICSLISHTTGEFRIILWK